MNFAFYLWVSMERPMLWTWSRMLEKTVVVWSCDEER